MEGVVISQLPEDIIHQILSFFEMREAAGTCLFCKTWYRAWLSCPTLNFGDDSLYSFPEQGRKQKFLKFMKSTLRRYQEQKIGIAQLTMPLFITDSYSVPIIDECIKIAVQNGVRRLELDFYRQRGGHCTYALPGELFEAKTLREFIVHGSVSGLDEVLWSDHKVIFNNLQALHLTDIYLNDDMLEGIIQKCPLIEELQIDACKGLLRIKVNNLYNLKKLTVSVLAIGSIEIDAPKLQDFDCRLCCGCSLDLYTTQELKYLSIFGRLPSAATFFDNFMHKFPKLEDLRLTYCFGLEKINISNHSLKRVMLEDNNDLREVKINAPSVVSFQLSLATMTFFPDVSLTNVSSQLKSQIICPPDWEETCELSKAKGFLAKLVPSKISIMLSLNHYFSKFDASSIKIPISPVIEVENLHLDMEYGFPPASTFADFLDSLFMTCHPRAITIRTRNNHTVAAGLFCENLMARRDQGFEDVTLEIYELTIDEWPFTYRFCYRIEWESHSHIVGEA